VPTVSLFQPPPAAQIEFVQFLTRSDLTLHEIADAFNTTLEALTLYLTSEEGLAQIATTELACALRIRLAAMHHLPRAVDALGTMLEDYTQSTRNLPARESSSNLQSQTLREEQRKNARRASHLLFRLAHFTPRPIRAYTHTSQDPTPTLTPPSTPASPPTRTQASTQNSIQGQSLQTESTRPREPILQQTSKPAPAPTNPPTQSLSEPNQPPAHPTAKPRRREHAVPQPQNTS